MVNAMIRTFQAKTTFKQYALLAVLLSVVVLLYWLPLPKPAMGAIFAATFMLMAHLVTRMVATYYVIHSEGHLEITRGKLMPDKHINLSDIKQIDKIKRGGTIVIVMNNGEEHFLTPPKNEEDFIKCIQKYRS